MSKLQEILNLIQSETKPINFQIYNNSHSDKIEKQKHQSEANKLYNTNYKDAKIANFILAKAKSRNEKG